MTNILICKGENSKKLRILLLALTLVAAMYIIGTTIHAGLGINVEGKMYPPNDCQIATFFNRLSEI